MDSSRADARSQQKATYAPPISTDPVELTDLLPPSPATADLLCWLWAAIPPRPDGRLHIARAADALGVSDPTIRRWIKNSRAADMPRPAEAKIPRLRQLAILRGRGQMLWPPLDRTERERQLALLEEARRALLVTTDSPHLAPVSWTKPCTVYVVHYPKARVYGVAYGTSRSAPSRIRAAGGDIVDEAQVSNRHAAALMKETVLEGVRPARCIPPRSLVPAGRTSAWRQTHQPVPLTSIKERDLYDAAALRTRMHGRPGTE